MLQEFKKFAMRGNVLDLAVAVVMGGAFGKIVSSLVDHILMPMVGILVGGFDVSNLSFRFGTAVVKYGMFLQSVIDFLFVAAGIFLFIKLIDRAKAVFEKEEEEKPKAPPKPTKEQLLLEEIRDLLKEQRRSA